MKESGIVDEKTGVKRKGNILVLTRNQEYFETQIRNILVTNEEFGVKSRNLNPNSFKCQIAKIEI